MTNQDSLAPLSAVLNRTAQTTSATQLLCHYVRYLPNAHKEHFLAARPKGSSGPGASPTPGLREPARAAPRGATTGQVCCALSPTLTHGKCCGWDGGLSAALVRHARCIH
jgi:hypothetical protein